MTGDGLLSFKAALASLSKRQMWLLWGVSRAIRILPGAGFSKAAAQVRFRFDEKWNELETCEPFD
jgi:hypothetical protein